MSSSIVTVERARPRKGFLGFGRVGVPTPAIGEAEHVYLSMLQPDGSREIRRVTGTGNGNHPTSADGVQIYRVKLVSFPFISVWSKVLTDSQGHAWDCQIAGHISVCDSRRVLTSFGATNASPNAPLTATAAESWLAARLSPRIRKAITDCGVAEEGSHQAVPVSWWQQRLSGWLAEFGLDGSIDEVNWVSAEAEAAEAEAAREQELERLAQAREREREAEIREAAAAAEYERQKKQIEADLTVSEQDRSHHLQLLEKKRRREMIEADAEIENARRESERAALEHELMLARLQRDAAAVTKAEERARNAEKQHQAVTEQLDALKTTLDEIANFPDNMLARLAERDTVQANAAAERLVSPEFGIPAAALAGLGYAVEPQHLVDRLRKKAQQDSGIVAVRKTDLVMRDIGTAKVKGLSVNTPLQFKFVTQRSGYVTLLNIGTSGATYVHVPNAFVSVEQAYVQPGHAFRIPGTHLLPWEQLRQAGLDYVEAGPPGWEHIGVIVSNEPLMDSRIVAGSSVQDPFPTLPRNDVVELCERLDNTPAGTWSSGVLSFLVE